MKNNQIIGIYIHVPFCMGKCAYCDFLSAPAAEEEQNQYMECLLREISLTALANPTEALVESIFFGGGTPSILNPHWIVMVLHTIRKNYKVSATAEITVECNPGTLTAAKVEIYKKAGVNRISLGLQSAHNKELVLLGRIHTWENFLESYNLVRKCGISNINIDLMSSLPGQTMESWQDTLKKVTDLNPEHISAYSLILEPGTPFYDKYKEHPEYLPSEELDRHMYAWTKTWLGKQGYERYEISNYAKKGRECRHNNFYWTGISYMGFGIGAASFYEGIRYTNLESRKKYITLLSHKELQKNPKVFLETLRQEIHICTREEQIEEFTFLGLRRIEGISQQEFEAKFGISFLTLYKDIVENYEKQGLLVVEKGRIALTDTGIDVSNVILAEFLL